MEDNELRKLLEQVHNEIERTPAIDENSQALLSDLDNDIRALLSRSRIHSKTQQKTIRRIEDTIDRLEVTHPNLTTMLSELLATLSNSGI